MADFPIEDGLPQGGQSYTKHSFSTGATYIGAVASLALMVGIGVWGYKIVARDVSGVPVVRAVSDGPMRIAPEDPGGSTAAHQGLSVNEVMAEGGAEEPAERLVLAPKPVSLTEEDTVGGAAVAAAAPVTPLEEEVMLEVLPEMGDIQALAEQLAAGVAPLGDTAEAEPITVAAVVPADPVNLPRESVQTAQEAASVAPSSVGAKTLRPRVRPVALRTTQPPAAVPAPQPQVAVSVPAGTRLVQLGAFDSEDVAKSEWKRLSGRFGDYMDGKTQVVQKATSGGRVFYRLRAMGFADLNDARRFCAALVAERADCIPVVQK